ncbi:MAG TPA: hypothetical protein VKA27_12510 [Sunxiuqinia sp.]|nr:hypothetical protein [Sunxiuqinia sp.]
MISKNSRKVIRNILMVILVIVFLALVASLASFWENNPLQNYRLVLGIGFFVLIGVTKLVCQNCRDKKVGEEAQ